MNTLREKFGSDHVMKQRRVEDRLAILENENESLKMEIEELEDNKEKGNVLAETIRAVQK